MTIEVVFRADAYAEIGTGHVMRCLALANACREAGMATSFIGYITDDILLARISRQEHQVNLLTEHNRNVWLNNLNPNTTWVILDGYEFNCADHRKIRDTGKKLLVIDDMANLESYDADVILNQNFHANAEHYKQTNHVKMLMGPKFAMLRQEFIEFTVAEMRPEVSRLLVTLGGSDPLGIGLIVLEALTKIHNHSFEVLFIAGSSNPNLEKLTAYAELANSYGHQVNVQHYTEQMPNAMAWADFGIIAAGSTSLEVAYMGLPTIVIVLAENQAAIASAMHRLGIAESLGWYDQLNAQIIANAIIHLANSASQRISMSQGGRSMVDGQGARRIASIFAETCQK